MSKRFEGKNVVVTGGAQGMGRAIGAAFVKEGAQVLLAALNADGVAATAKELGTLQARCDVTNSDDVSSLISTSVDQLGSVDVLVNNAGTITMKNVVDMEEREWDMVMDVNAKGVFLCTKAVLPHMLERGSGAIVNIASQAGKRGSKPFPHYCGSNAAVSAPSQGTVPAHP